MEKKKIVIFEREGHAPEYFSSIRALFRNYTSNEVGAVINSVYNAISQKGSYNGRKSSIKISKMNSPIIST